MDSLIYTCKNAIEVVLVFFKRELNPEFKKELARGLQLATKPPRKIDKGIL